MEFVIDILDDRLEAIEAGDDDRERLRRYLDLWRAGAVAPLSDPGVVVVATLDDGPRPRRVVANDGEGDRGAPAVRTCAGSRDAQLPKLDVVGSVPIARSGT